MLALQPLRLDARLLPPQALAAEPADRLLGVVTYRGGSVESARALLVRLPLEPLGAAGDGPHLEIWRSTDAERPVAVSRRGAVELAGDGRVLFGHLRAPAADEHLEPAALDAYRQLLSAATAEGYPHLLRIWASVPGIHRCEQGIERYRAFCRARGAAFEEAWGSGFTRRLPASTAVGTDDCHSELVVYFLAAAVPGVHFENPRQVAAYRYPHLYGPRSPSFARATRAPDELGGGLFVSGTASIVGHASVHGDLAGQIRETVRNLERVRQVAELGGRPLAWSLLKVYLRHAADEADARRLLAGLFPQAVPSLFLRADVCRRELRIEIEGVAVPAA